MLIDYLGRKEGPQKCLEMFKEMVTNDVLPSLYTYNALLDSLGRYGDLRHFNHLLDHMKIQKITFNDHTLELIKKYSTTIIKKSSK